MVCLSKHQHEFKICSEPHIANSAKPTFVKCDSLFFHLQTKKNKEICVKFQFEPYLENHYLFHVCSGYSSPTHSTSSYP